MIITLTPTLTLTLPRTLPLNMISKIWIKNGNYNRTYLTPI